MSNKLQLVLLIDDEEASNMINEKVIKKTEFADKTIAVTSALKALSILNSMYDEGKQLPQLIFLDINMPAMNGWEFIEEFNKMPYAKDTIIIMLTTSLNPADVKKAKATDSIKAFRNKPLSAAMLKEIKEAFFDTV